MVGRKYDDLVIRLGLAALLLLSAPACRRDVPTITTPTESPSAPASISPEPALSADVLSCPKQTGGEDGVFVNLAGVRFGNHEDLERVTFEFAPSDQPGGRAGIPRFEYSKVDPPIREDGSGEIVEVEGSAFGQIVFHGASGYVIEGETPRQTYSGPKEHKPSFEVLLEAQQTGDFEATLSWALGLNRTVCPAIRTLQNPLRVTLDFLTQ